MPTRTFRNFLLVLLLFTISGGLPAQSRNAPGRSSRTSKTKANPTAAAPLLPSTIQLRNGETIPLAELVPRTESALTQIGQIMEHVRTPEVKQAEAALQSLMLAVSNSAEGTKASIRMARSALQLPEIKLVWMRNRSQLDGINSVVVKYATGLDGAQAQIADLRQNWTAIVEGIRFTKLPDEYVQRAIIVLTMADKSQTTLREETENLLKLQVQVSDTRSQIDDVLDQLNIADAALREQVFVIDSPPIWSAFHQMNIRATWDQVKTIVSGIRNRTSNFYQAYRSKVFVYFLLNVGIAFLLFRFSQRDTARWGISNPTHVAILSRPAVLSLFVMLSFFGLVFANAPPEIVRFSRTLLVFPMVVLSIAIFDAHLRPHLIGLGAIYVVNVTTLQLLAGTVMRRFINLGIGSVLLAGMYVLLRKDGVVRKLLDERRWFFVLNSLYVAGFLLLLSVIANIIGNVALADVLTTGTVFGIYYGVGCYVFYLALVALTWATTGSRIGQRSRAIRLHTELVNRKIAVWLRAVSWLIWGLAVLISFQISNQAFTETRDILRHKWQIGAISLSLLDVVLFVLVLYVSTLVAKLVRFLLDEEVLPRTEMNPGVAQAGSRLTYIALLSIGFFLSLGAAGLELSKITVLTGAFGVGLGFGLQNVVNNFVCGIIVSLERPVQVGDIVEVGTLMGEVRTIGFRSSTVRTFDGADVIVPNSELITKPVVNWSLTDLYRRTDISIGVAYGTDPKRVLSILTNIISSHRGVLKHPVPLITFDQFADSSLNFTVRFWSKLDERLQVRSELNIQIAEEFGKDGIEIPFPQRDVHLFLSQSGEADLGSALKSRSAKASASE